MKPVYQMALSVTKDRSLGLVFSSEGGFAPAESLMFVIPVPTPLRYYDLAEYFDRERFYFPAYVRDDVVNVESETDFPFIRFRVPGTGDYITFELLWFRAGRVPFSNARSELETLAYVGTDRSVARDGFHYVPLIPDVVAMDDAYTKHGFALVGLTPQFGTLREESR